MSLIGEQFEDFNLGVKYSGRKASTAQLGAVHIISLLKISHVAY